MPTRVRYLVVLAATLTAVLLYLERVCLGVADVYVREDLGLSTGDMDLVFGAFFWAYALGQVPAGWLAGRFGPRRMLAVYAAGWSVFGAFIALAQDFWTLFAARFLLGLSQAGAYPTAALLVKRWAPAGRWGLASGVVAFGGRVGGAGANVLTGVLIVAFVPLSAPATLTAEDLVMPYEVVNDMDAARSRGYAGPHDAPFRAIRDRVRTDSPSGEQLVAALNGIIRTPGAVDPGPGDAAALSYDARAVLVKPPADRTPAESERLNRVILEAALGVAVKSLHTPGWRPTLMAYAVAGLVVGGLFWAVARDSPRQHPRANAAEVALIEGGHPAEEPAAPPAVPWRALMTSPNQWAFSANQFFGNVGWVFLITLLPRFLADRFGVPVDLRGLMTTVPLAAGAAGMLAGGWLTDRLVRRHGRRLGRALPMGALKVPCALMLAAAPFLPGPWAVVAALAVMAAFQDAGVPAVWAFAQDTGGRDVAAVLGWANMWGNVGAGVAPVLLGGIAARAGWDAALLTGAAAFLAAAAAGLATDAGRPVASEDSGAG